jgi:hypothetical protein
MSKMKSLKHRGLIGGCQSADSPIENRSSPGLMICSRANDDTLIFSSLGGPLKTKDQPSRTTHDDVRSNKQHMNSPIITL